MNNKKEVLKEVWWDSADLNRSPSVPNARGWTRLPYYPKRVSTAIDVID